MKYKKKCIVLLVMIIGVSIGCTGCGKDEANESAKPKEKIVKETVKEEVKEETKEIKEEISSGVIKLDDDMRAGAKEEGISKSEMLEIVTELTLNDAKKYGASVEEYITTLQEQGFTPFTAQKQVADYMEISIKELYEFGNMAENMGIGDDKGDYVNPAAGMNEIDASGVLPGAATTTVTGDIQELLHYKVKDIDSKEEVNGDKKIFYYSEESYENLIEYFSNLLKGTEMYFIMESDIATTIIGTINGKEVTIAVHNLKKYEPDLKVNGVTLNY